MNIKSHPLVRSLPSNQKGRDFVVGDLHGCFDLLDRLLEAVRFDPTCDRLLSVGDLVDRGPDSLRCLSFLEAPWFHAVKGNHESMLLEYFESYLSGDGLDDWEQVTSTDMWLNGGDWIAACYRGDEARMSSEFDRFLAKIGDLPLIWVVGEGRDRFHVLHGELVHPDYRKSRQKVWLDADIDGWLAGGKIDALTQERLLWGRTLMMMLASPVLPAMQPGLSTTFCGHTIDMRVRSYLSHVCLDTGAYRSLEEGGFGLTLYCVNDGRELRASCGCPDVVDVRAMLSA